MTIFTPAEASHPLNFFEQSVRCKHCGCDRLRPSRARLCCKDGSLLLGGEPNHEALIELLSEGDGVSQTSRSLNDLFRFAQQGLPKGTHRLNLAGGHLKVTGVPFAVIDNFNANTSTRSFYDDPAYRELRANRVDSAYRPTERSISIVRRVLEESPLARSLVNWAEADAPAARLELKWPGSTFSVRSFTVSPSTSIIGPRTVFFTRLDEDKKCYLHSDDPLYAPLMWPLAFPSGAPLLDRQGRLVDGKRSGPTAARPNDGDAASDAPMQECAHAEHGMRQTTLAMLMQPQRDSADECVLLPTFSPYGAEHNHVLRRFSALEKLGRLGDEIMLDRWLSVQDARLRFLSTPMMQQRMAGQFLPEDDADAAEQQNGTYLPPSEIGSPRYMRDRCANALAVHRKLGKAALFITMTTDLKDWPEVWTRLPVFNGTKQDPFDRAAIHSEVSALRDRNPLHNVHPVHDACNFSLHVASLALMSYLVSHLNPFCPGTGLRAQAARDARTAAIWHRVAQPGPAQG